jgi:hypothetical protein
VIEAALNRDLRAHRQRLRKQLQDRSNDCPFGELFQNPKRLKKFADKLKKTYKTRKENYAKEALELLQIIKWATDAKEKGSLDWRECGGEHLKLAPPGFANVSIATILPPNKSKGPLHSAD